MAGSCGTAAYLGEPVIVEDTQTDPKWAEFKHLAAPHNLRACWSLPFFNRDAVAGTFAIYYDHVCRPAPLDLELVEEAARLAGIAVERANSRRKHYELEKQVQLSQKLEGLGLLAGGIAHDFNNMLVAVVGNADLLAMDLEDEKLLEYVSEIQHGAARAAELADQILTYAGQRDSKHEAFDLTELVHELRGLVSSSLSKRIEIELQLAPDLPPLLGDSAQIGQVLMNLLTNAADAIGDKVGRITVRTGLETLSRSDLSTMLLGADLAPGDYVVLEVEDDGNGLDEDARAHMFDPFFSTKSRGRGLGLATAFGIVRAHHGAIGLDSKAGVGTHFRVALPQAEQQAAPSNPTEARPFQGSGLALVVDDEIGVRRVASTFLRRLGFDVITAESGETATKLFSLHSDDLRLLLVDISMPGMGGRQLLSRLDPLPDHVRAIFTTGFDPEDIGADEPSIDVPILHKPYDLNALQRTLHQAFSP